MWPKPIGQSETAVLEFGRDQRIRYQGSRACLIAFCLLVLLIQSMVQAGSLHYAPVTGSITSNFGWRSDPMHGGSRFHSGVDIAAAQGTPIYATQAGQVVYSGRYKGYGNVVVLYHGDQLYTLYGHAAYNYVQQGEMVRRGQAIAAVGSTGRSTGPHLHFEVHQNKQYVDPLKYLNYMNQFQTSGLDVASVTPAPRIAQAPAPKVAQAPAPILRRVEADGGVTYLQNTPVRRGKGVQVISGNSVKMVNF
jgi:murein DD-endopeptidase MepM/ murein hydrolase activator NlpD